MLAARLGPPLSADESPDYGPEGNHGALMIARFRGKIVRCHRHRCPARPGILSRGIHDFSSRLDRDLPPAGGFLRPELLPLSTCLEAQCLTSRSRRFANSNWLTLKRAGCGTAKVPSCAMIFVAHYDRPGWRLRQIVLPPGIATARCGRWLSIGLRIDRRQIAASECHSLARCSNHRYRSSQSTELASRQALWAKWSSNWLPNFARGRQ